MPQKLIRLTCESNDGIFNGKFDEDIHIKKDSEIAFQSLTMERNPEVLTIDSTNDAIRFRSRLLGVADQVGNIKHGTYGPSNKPTFLKNITDAMNGACDFTAFPTQMNTQWECGVDDRGDDTTIIACRPSPMFPLASFNPNTGLAEYNTKIVRDAPDAQGVPNAEVPTIAAGGMGRLTQSAAGLLNECYMYMGQSTFALGDPKISFIKSTGSWRIRLAAMTVGTANRPAFTLGLVDDAGLVKLEDATITLDDLHYAIQVDENSADPAQGGYSYINLAGSAAVTATAPLVKIENAALATVDTNDVLEIAIKNGKLQGFIHQDTAGRTALPATAASDYHTKDMYPVVFFHLANTTGPVVNNLIDYIQCSLDPWADNAVGQALSWYDYVKNNPQLQPYNRLDSLATTTKYDPPNGVAEVEYETRIELETIGVANFLGYTNKVLCLYDALLNPARQGVGAVLGIPNDLTLTDPNSNGGTTQYTTPQGYAASGRKPAAFAVDAESYLVDTQTFMLDSYDTYGLSIADRNSNSGGSRRNLIATIPAVTQEPIVGSTNVRVVYEPNTLDYIAIKNKSDIITRQIRVRLLDAKYLPVATVGLAAITVLVRDQLGYEER